MSTYVLGIAGSHNGAACILKDGKLVVGIQEERLTGVKRHNVFGSEVSLAVAYCLSACSILASELAAVGYCSQTSLRRPEHQLRESGSLKDLWPGVPIYRMTHHYGHALSGFYRSGYANAAILVIDGMGSPYKDLPKAEQEVTGSEVFGCEGYSMYHASGDCLLPIDKGLVAAGQWLPGLFDGRPGMSEFNSVGGMYSAIAMQIFGNPMAAGKVMGLAPFGTPRYPSSLFFEIVHDKVSWKRGILEHFKFDFRYPHSQELPSVPMIGETPALSPLE